jgi:hypothetical protein
MICTLHYQVHHDMRQRHPHHHRVRLEGVDRASADERRPLELLLRLPRHRQSPRLDRHAQVSRISWSVCHCRMLG